MDLSVIQKNHESMGVEGFANQIGSHVYNLKDTFTETDVKGNNNLFHTFKTENRGHGHDPSSLFQDDHADESNTKLENSPYSPLKKAIDLRVHNRTLDGGRRTIFEDADYFAKNFCYKLLPINFENVDETIIHTEHNYSLFSLCSESETEEDCSRTMDYSQIKEKNYKRRRTKFREGNEENNWDEEERADKGQDFNLNGSISEDLGTEALSETEHSFAVQPLDLSSPLVQEEKTEHHQTEHPTSIVANQEGEENKENVNSKLGCIEVTITRPDEKEKYQPCDLFLNDIARLVPRLIEKNCSGIDILDKTCERYHVDIQRHRLYYIIAESTWKLFQSTKERIILTNDGSLGEPVQRREKVSRPTFLVFDQFSLAKCLADYCQEIGGCFEYTFLEPTKNLEQIEGKKEEEVVKIKDDLVTDDKEKVEKKMVEKETMEEIEEKEMVEKETMEEIVEKEMVEKETMEEIEEKEMVEKETMEEIEEKEMVEKETMEEIEEKEMVEIETMEEIVEKEMVEIETMEEIVEKEMVERETMEEIEEKEMVEKETMEEIEEKEMVEKETMEEIEEKEMVEIETIEEIVEKEMVERETMEEIVEKEMVERQTMEEIVEKEMVERETMEEIVEKEMVERETMEEILEKGMVEKETMEEIEEKEMVEKETIEEIVEKEMVERETMEEIVEKEMVERETMEEIVEKEMVEKEIMEEIEEKEMVEKETMEEIVEKEMVERETMEEIVEKEMVERETIEEIVEKEMVEKETMEQIMGEESIKEKEVPNCGEILLPGDVVAEQKTELSELSKSQKSSPEVGIKIKENNPAAEVRPNRKEKYPQQKLTEKVTKTKAARRETNPYRSKQPNHSSHIKTRSKSTSESSETPNNVKTSQKGEERSSKRGRNKQEEKVPVKEETPEKRRKVSAYKGPRMGTNMERRTRSGKSLDVEIGKKKPKARDKKQKIARKQEEETMRTRLRSRKGTQGNEGNKRKLLQRRR